MKGKFLVSSLMLLMVLIVCSSASWAAIGVYKCTAGASVPSTISYMLNVDADDVSGTWSVQIEIVPVDGGAPVKTFSYLSPDPMTKRGSHSVVWDGSADAGGQAPTGKYKAIITAKAAPVTGTAMKGIFGAYNNTSRAIYYAAAVNKNVGSPWYGCIYVIVYNAGVQILQPDGTPIGGVRSGGVVWTGSSPFGIAIDASDNVWIDARSGNTDTLKRINIFKPDMSSRLYGPFLFTDYPKCCDVLGPTNNAYLLDSECYTSGGWAKAYNRFGSWHGDFTSLASGTTLWDWQSAVGAGAQMVQQVKLVDEGGTGGPVIYAPSREWVSGSAFVLSAGLTKYSMDWDPASPTKGKPTQIWYNPSLTTGMAVDITPDGLTMGMSRNIGMTDDANAFWLFPVATAETVVNTDASVLKYSISEPPGTILHADDTPNGWQHNKINYFRFDTVGNVVGVYGNMNPEAAQPGYALWVVPDNGSTNSQTTGEIKWSHPQPRIDSTNGPVPISSCVSGATATATINASCADGIDKIASVTVDFTPLNKPGQGIVTLSGDGSGAWTTSFGVGSGLKAGDYECPITITSTWPDVSPTTGTLVVRVAGATITGKVTNSKTGWVIAGATVTATGDSTSFTTTTDANGDYTLSVNVASYAVSATSSEYGTQAGGAVSFAVTCGQVKVQNLQLDPQDVHTANGGNTNTFSGRAPNELICTVGTVARLPQQGTDQGFNGYYFLTDTSFENKVQGVRVMNWTGSTAQPTLHEGDLVVVEGNWKSRGDLGLKEGYIEPLRAPVIVGTGTKPQPDPFYTSYAGIGTPLPEENVGTAYSARPYGGLYHAYGKVISVDTVGGTATGNYGPNFMMESPSSAANPAVQQIRVRVDTPATTGVDFTNIVVKDKVIHVIGFLAHIDGTWTAENECLVVAKAADVYEFSDAVKSVGEAKAVADGGTAYMAKAQVTVVGDGFVYVESPDRTAGLRIEGTIPTTGRGAIGAGDLIDFHGTMASTAQGEKYITTDLLQRSNQDHTAMNKPLDAIGMSSRAANDAGAMGLFVKTWGKVTAVNSDNFVITDGGYPIKVKCGAAMEKPSVGQTVRVRGAVSKDADGLALCMRNERVDWTTGDANYQPLPFPGAYKYPMEFLVLGPFKDANSAPASATPTDQELIDAETYRLQHDFIADATGNQVNELTLAGTNPRLGGKVGDYTWTRGTSTGGNVALASNPPGAALTNVTFYAHLWVYSPVQQDLTLRIGSDDFSKVIISNSALMAYWGADTVQIYASDPVTGKGRGEVWGNDSTNLMTLAQGWNSVLIKVENGGGPSGADIQFVDLYNFGGGDFGGATPISGLGYLLDKPAE